jgi:lysozyme
MTMPEFDASLLTFMGICSGANVGFKFPEKRKTGDPSTSTAAAPAAALQEKWTGECEQSTQSSFLPLNSLILRGRADYSIVLARFAMIDRNLLGGTGSRMANQFIEGIDVSSNQGQVDWTAVKRAGKAFAFARATIGGHQLDSQFATNWQRMRDAGIIRGAYHFFWPSTPWQDQAELFTKTIGSLSPGDLPPALDLEEAMAKGDSSKHDAWQDVAVDQRLFAVQSWLDAVQQAHGRRPMIYTRQNFIEPLFGDGITTLAASGLWIAHYKVAAPRTPSTWASWTFWQYLDTGSVEGVHGNVDCDRFNGLPEDLQNLTKN